ncbi:MAG: nucleotide-binding protein [Agathobacter sp.]|nr:nucleotide-binding protein [Agathobacter sp.]
MKVDYIVSCLEKTQIVIEENKRSGNNLATVLKLSNGCIINCYDSGKVVYQGKNTDEVKNIIEHTAQIVRKEEKNRKVFVVYGHDLNARTQLEAMLRRWDIEPLIIDQLVSSGQTIIEKLEENTDKVQFGIVLATPDDIGYSKGKEECKKYRVRQNVILELGMLLSKVGRSKVAILLSQAEEMEKPSDIDGLIYIPFTNNVEEAKVSLAKELQRNGYEIDITKL